tara:strand:- start:259 stop:873 length:615 start_codon:yes stop_codon:yes gene_type:complete
MKYDEIIRMNTTAWPFYLDKMPPYAWVRNFLTPEQCDDIVKYGKSLFTAKGKIGGTNPEATAEIKGARDSSISWIKPVEDYVWLYRKIVDAMVMLNHEHYKFDMWGLAESLQFTSYGPKQHYFAHTDRGTGVMVRKLSCTIQLTDPKKYKGGDLVIYESRNGTNIEREQGLLVVFPSFMLHEVTPVKKGERNSLVCWASGAAFK